MQAPTTLLGVLWTVTTSLNKLAQLTLQRLCIMGLSDECLCQLFQTFTFTCRLLQVMFGKSQGEQSTRERDLSCTSLEEMSIYISQSHQRALSISVNFI